MRDGGATAHELIACGSPSSDRLVMRCRGICRSGYCCMQLHPVASRKHDDALWSGLHRDGAQIMRHITPAPGHLCCWSMVLQVSCTVPAHHRADTRSTRAALPAQSTSRQLASVAQGLCMGKPATESAMIMAC